MNARTAAPLVLVAALAAPSAWAQPNIPNPPQIGNPAKKAVDEFFSGLKNRAIADADRLGEWKRDAEAAARKTAADFTSCPSPAAQTQYDDLKAKRQKAAAARDAAAQALADADRALSDCMRTWPDGPGGFPPSACRAAYNGLPFKNIRDAAQAAMDALDVALNALRALKCIAGCNRTAGVDYPSCTLAGAGGGGPVHVNTGGAVAASQSKMLGSQIEVAGKGFDVCVEWDPGSLTAVWNPGPQGVQAGVDFRYPKCKRTVHVPGSVCGSWDVSLVLPKLKELKLVPPEVKAGNLKIEVATQTISYVTVEQAPSCRAPLVLCVSSSANPVPSVPMVLPQDLARSMGPQCTAQATIGCMDPPYNLNVVSRTASVPDPSRGTVSWQLPKPGSPGSVKVDFTRPEFSIACRQWVPGPSTGSAPAVNCSTKHMDLPFLCLEPRMGNVVGRP